MNKEIMLLFILLLLISVLPVISASEGNNSDTDIVKTYNKGTDTSFIGDITGTDIEYSYYSDEDYLDDNNNIQEVIYCNKSKNYNFSDLNLENRITLKNYTNYNFSNMFTHYSYPILYNNILNNSTSSKNTKYVLVIYNKIMELGQSTYDNATRAYDGFVTKSKKSYYVANQGNTPLTCLKGVV